MHVFVAGLQAQLGWSWKWCIEKWIRKTKKSLTRFCKGTQCNPTQIPWMIWTTFSNASLENRLVSAQRLKAMDLWWPRWIWQWFTFPMGCASSAVLGLKGESHSCMEFATTEMFPGFVKPVGVRLWPRCIYENISSSSTTAYSQISLLSALASGIG